MRVVEAVTRASRAALAVDAVRELSRTERVVRRVLGATNVRKTEVRAEALAPPVT